MQTETRPTRIVDPILMEMDMEAEITKRLLDIIPEDKLSWRPHPKAKSLGELAMHLATLQGAIAELGKPDAYEFGGFPLEVEASNRGQISEAFAESLKKANEIVDTTDDARAIADWKLTKEGKTFMAMPRVVFWMTI